MQIGFQVSGSCSAVYRDKVLWNAGYGVVDKSTLPLKAPNEDTLYRTGSLVKLLTVYNQWITFNVHFYSMRHIVYRFVKVLVTFKLLQQKKLHCLDDPLQKYFPEFRVKNPFNSDTITIR